MLPPLSHSQSLSTTMSFRIFLQEMLLIWLLILFVRTFIVDNYRIPSGSMMPTLLGGMIAKVDLDKDGTMDWVQKNQGHYLAFLIREEGFEAQLLFEGNDAIGPQIREQMRHRSDHILVNKMCYWFASPAKGDMVVFKPPRRIFDPTAPIYVKRVVGAPGDLVDVGDQGHLMIDGSPYAGHPFLKTQRYGLPIHAEIAFPVRLDSEEYLVFGDNTYNSADGRYWGTLPQNRIRGKLAWRYWPFNRFGSLTKR